MTVAEACLLVRFVSRAKSVVPHWQGDVEDAVTAFIVERSFGGVTSGNRHETMGIRGADSK